MLGPSTTSSLIHRFRKLPVLHQTLALRAKWETAGGRAGPSRWRAPKLSRVATLDGDAQREVLPPYTALQSNQNVVGLHHVTSGQFLH